MTFVIAIVFMLITARCWFPLNGLVVSRLTTDAAARPEKVSMNFAIVSMLQFGLVSIPLAMLWSYISLSRFDLILMIVCAPYTIIYSLLGLGALFTLTMMLFKRPTIVTVQGRPRFAMSKRQQQ
jgi:hypothetical protein